MRLNQRGKSISTSVKFANGVILMGLGYIVLMVGIHFHNALGFTLLIWVVLGYFFQTAGELFVGPVGLAMVGSLVPAHYEGIMMGIWQLAIGVAGSISEFLAEMTATPKDVVNPIVTNHIYSNAFMWIGGVTVVIGFFAFLLVPYIKRISGHSANVSEITETTTHATEAST